MSRPTKLRRHSGIGVSAHGKGIGNAISSTLTGNLKEGVSINSTPQGLSTETKEFQVGLPRGAGLNRSSSNRGGGIRKKGELGEFGLPSILIPRPSLLV